MQILKWILIAVVTVVLLVVGYVAFILDLNSFKPVISDKVKEQTGRELTIDGDIGLSIFPTLGLELQGVTLSNIPGEQLPPLLSINQASVGVALTPLLKSELQVESLVVEGAELTMVTLADGRTSVSGLGAESESSESVEPSGESAPAKGASEWSLGLFQLNDLKLVNDNRITEIVQTITVTQLQLNDLAPARSAPLKLVVTVDDGSSKIHTEASSMLAFAKDFSHIQIDDWQQLLRVEQVDAETMQLDLSMQADIDLNKQVVALPRFGMKIKEFVFDAQGALDYGAKVPSLSLTGSGNELDLTPYMASSGDAEAKPNDETKPPQESSSEEPDLRGLAAIDAVIDLSLDSLIADKIRVDAINTKVVLKDGVLTLEQLVGKTFEGNFKITASLDGRQVPASYQFSETLEGLQIQPMMVALAGSDKLIGAGNLSMSGKGKGLAGDALINNLSADGKLMLEDGAVNGVNVAQMIREGKARFTGENVEEASVEQKTDFTTFDIGLKVRDGQLIVPDLALASPLVRVSGNGALGLIDQSLGAELVVALVASSKGQGGKSTDELTDVPIPLKLGGSLSEPTYGIDFSGLQKELLNKEKDKLKNKLEDKLKSKLFGG